MFTSMMERQHITKKLTGKDKIDPGSFSFLESKWWVLHSLMITGIFLLGYKVSSRSQS